MKNQISMIDGYEYESPTPTEQAAKSRRLVRPQDQYGLANNGKTCKSCKHLVCRRMGRTYYKCTKWTLSCSCASDVRVKWQACKLYEQE